MGGNISARKNLSLLYASGDGVTTDLGRASAWMSFAAVPGNDAQAQYLVGLLYEKGNVQIKSYGNGNGKMADEHALELKAFEYYCASANIGYEDARKKSDQLRPRFTPQEIEAAKKAAAGIPKSLVFGYPKLIDD